jgi:hypothetical protein
VTIPRSDDGQRHINLSKKTKGQKDLSTMKKGYKEMAEINLSISQMYFEAESEVASYYDRISGV